VCHTGKYEIPTQTHVFQTVFLRRARDSVSIIPHEMPTRWASHLAVYICPPVCRVIFSHAIQYAVYNWPEPVLTIIITFGEACSDFTTLDACLSVRVNHVEIVNVSILYCVRVYTNKYTRIYSYDNVLAGSFINGNG